MGDVAYSAEASEQRYIDRLYARLDQLRTQTAARLADVRQEQTRHHQALYERDVEVLHLENALARYDVGGAVLCFGRLDLRDGQRHYIGRVGISDAAQDTLLVDWRAPAAEPFYRATPHDPQGVGMRRHLLCEGRRLVAIDDEVFDVDVFETEAAKAGDGAGTNLRGEAALFAALTRRRTGRMADIVATIQAEQDAIIRAPLEGVLLVQGGPGTGKTAVALHRAAYLLYTHRVRLAAQGVLILGPTSVFLRYIEQVLPALGETGAVLARVGDMFPGVASTGTESAAVAQIKGRAEMVSVLEEAVHTRQRVLRDDVNLDLGAILLTVTPHMTRAARSRARKRRLTHNLAKPVFEAALLDMIVEQAIEKDRALGRPNGHSRRSEMRATLRRSLGFRTLAARLWPTLTPTELLRDLLSSRVLIRAAGKGLLSPEDVRLLHRPDPDEDSEWTAADVPLLDEAAELLGEPPPPRQRRRGGRRSRDGDGASSPGLVDFLGDPAGPTLADAARGDRKWAYGHVIVDEAQELSPMAWRMIARRCPQLSMTVVGDWAQRSADWGTTHWSEALGPAASKLRLTDLTVNYRTPSEVMELAAAVLASADPGLEAPAAVREGGFEPWSMATDAEPLAEVAAGVVAAELRALGEGRMAVIVPEAYRAPVSEALRRGLADRVAVDEGTALERSVSVMDVRAVKGLEFDSVVIVEPGDIIAASPRGANDLYVALTRTTGRLGLLHTRPLPPELSKARAITTIDAIMPE
jgi:DNA helicase IV